MVSVGVQTLFHDMRRDLKGKKGTASAIPVVFKTALWLEANYSAATAFAGFTEI
jgi:hypothetical protein